MSENSPKPEVPESALALGRSLSESGQHLPALRHFASLLETHADREDVVTGAVQVLVAASDEEALLESWESVERERFYTALILQERCNTSPPILHHQIASQHTSGITDFIDRSSKILGPTISRLLEKNSINKNLILLILLLRESLNPWLKQATISKLHAEWLDKFTADDLRIPYNCMFDSVTFRRNRDDVVALLFNDGNNTDPLERLPLCHILIFEWLTQRDPLGGDRLLELVKKRAAANRLAPDELAAVRSLLIRHWKSEWSGISADLEALGIDRDTIELAQRTHTIRHKLQPTASARVDTIGMRLVDNRAWQGFQAARNIARHKLLPAASRRRKPKIAICVSGQLRGYREAFQSWKNTLLHDIDYEIFLHSWTRIGRSGAEPFRNFLPFEGQHFTEKYRESCLQVGLDEFKSRYPLLFRALTDTGNVTEDELREFYDTPHVHLDDDGQPPFAALSNQEKMHSKIQACFEMATAGGQEYDLIVRLRPDKLLSLIGYDWADLLAVCRASPTLFSDHAAGVHYTNPMIGDQFAMGAPEPMRVYSNTWTLHPQFGTKGLLRFPNAFQGHVSLAQICWHHGIRVKKMPIRFGSLAEPERLSSIMVLDCLKEDAASRMNRMDQLLLDAATADLKK